jgi:hypothetical protein
MRVARKVESHLALHGFLTALVATAMYLALIFGQFGSLGPTSQRYGAFQFALANVLRIVGGVAGAAAIGKRRDPILQLSR